MYFSSSNGEFSVTVIDILPLDITEFSLPASVESCEGNGDTVQPTLISGNSNGTWSISGGGVIDSSTGTIDVEASGSGTFTVTFSPNSPCPALSSQDIEISMGSSPSIGVFCSSSLNEVYFNWSAIEGVANYEISYSINGGNPIFSTTNGTDFVVSGLLPGDFVTITVEAAGEGICGGSIIESSSCNVSECPPVVIEFIDLDSFYCSDIASFELIATPAGGIFSGNGVENNATFNPALAGVGIHTLQYEYTDFNGCSYSTNATIEVVEPLEAVTIDCSNSDTDMVSFNWSEAIGYDFEVNYTVNGENPTTSIQSDNFFEVNNLNPQDEVEISVTILNDGVCGNSEMVSQFCMAAACEPIAVSIDNLADLYCSNEEAITLAANIEGGIFYVNAVAATVFDPAILGEGIHLVEYVLEQGNCVYSTEMMVEVENPLEAVLVECSAVTESSISFNWNEAANATEYQVILSGAISDVFTQTETTYTVENLAAGETVTIEVVVIGEVECANSPAAMATCSTLLVEEVECMDEAELNQLLTFPTAFSPNEDGVNDSFHPVFPYSFSDYELIVYNRWGQQVFGSRDVDAAWNGISLNSFKKAALGVYVWHLKAVVVNDCGEEMSVERKGNVTLVR